ncbi:MAG: hypothetical protein FJY88_00340 [Candidatus Eisenbacteria bacterium]|nr:hypothetical protein [Candidatus Eisenbacteria bacterium]
MAIEGFVVVYRAAGLAEAEIVKGYLVAQGIPVDLAYESAGPAIGITMDGLGEVRVAVPAEWEEAARGAIRRRLAEAARQRARASMRVVPPRETEPPARESDSETP